MPRSQAQVIEDLVAKFQADLTKIVAQARTNVVSTLSDRLSVVDGHVAKTKTNTRILQGIDDLFQKSMDRAGYEGLVKDYVSSFNGQFTYFQDTLDTLGEEIGRDLTIEFGKRDRALFIQQQVSTRQMLESTLDVVGSAAERQALLSIGGLPLGQLVGAISMKLDTTVAQATTLADTALSMFYRTITDRGYRLVERGLPDSMDLLYRYGGPDDKITRTFCHKMLARTRTELLTRGQIGQLNNGQLPNVFLTCGGYNCRHQWIGVVKTGG